MEKDKYISLIYKNLKAEISEGEKAELDAWLARSDANRNLAEQVTTEWEASQNYVPEIEVDMAGDFEKLRHRVSEHKARQEVPTQMKVVHKRPRRNWMKWVAAAAAFAVAYFGVSFLMNDVFGLNQEWVTAQTASGETKEVTLSDGSKVWLNEKTVFEYPTEFTDNERLVRLSGEAYFDVTKNQAAHFVVELEGAQARVLGTQFNLSAYPGDLAISLAVDEGRVRLQPDLTRQAAIVNRGERGVFSAALNKLELLPNLDENEAFWKNKTLIFNDRRLSEVLATLRREMKIGVELTDEYMESCRLTARFPDAKPKAVLEHLADYFEMELAEVSAGKYELRGGDCE